MLTAHAMSVANEEIFDKVLRYTAGFIGGILPDIDTEYGMIHRILGTGKLSVLFGKHRTFTHTIWAIGVIYLLGAPMTMVVAYVSHLLLDSINYSMIKPFYPVSFKVGAPLCKSGGDVDGMICMVLWAILIYVACI